MPSCSTRRRVARIHKIVTEEIQPKQHVSLPMTLRCSLACRKCKRIYRIHALDANSSHLRKLICFNYIRATSMDVPRLASASCNVATWRVGCRHLFGLLTQPRRLLALMRSADRHPITLSSSAARCCTRVWPIPVRPVMPSRRQSPSQTEGEPDVPPSAP